MATTLLRTASKSSHSKASPVKLAYTTKELCTALGISSRSLARLEERGLIRSSKVLRTKLFTHTEVERFLQETMVQPLSLPYGMQIS